MHIHHRINHKAPLPTLFQVFKQFHHVSYKYISRYNTYPSLSIISLEAQPSKIIIDFIKGKVKSHSQGSREPKFYPKHSPNAYIGKIFILMFQAHRNLL